MRRSRTVLSALTLLCVLAGCDQSGPTVDELAAMTFTRVRGSQTGGAVVDTGPAGSWNEQTVGTPTVVFDGAQYHMWFTGTPVQPPGESPYLYHSAIGAAISDDGIEWRVMNNGQPVFSAGPAGAFDSHAVGHPSVLRIGDRYVMWYGGVDGTQGPNSVRVERIGMATSTDGIVWTRVNDGQAVLDIGAPGDPDSIQATGPCVIHTPTGYVMWYGAYNGRHSLAAARSADGLQWLKGPVHGLGDDEALGPSVYRHGRDLLMWYSIVREHRWTLVAARSGDGTNWTPLRGGGSILGPAPPGSFDAAAEGANHSVHPSDLVFDAARARLWYMAEDPAPPFKQRIGLMEAARAGRR